MPEGMVEIVVSDNGSTDRTPAILAAYAEDFPIVHLRSDEDLGFDRNYLTCLEHAHGTFVWVVGDDDMLMPGSVARIFQALDEGADACLCASQEVDRDLKPLEVRAWYREPLPSQVFRLDGPEALGEYMDRLQYMGGIFAFISIAVFRRERFLAGRALFEQGMGMSWIHVWGMLHYLRTPTVLHWIAEPLIRNGVDNDVWSQTYPWGRLMHDLTGWIRIADVCLGHEPSLRRKLLEVLQRNHQTQIIRRLKFNSEEPWMWTEARAALLEVGYDPILVNAVGLTHDICWMDQPPPEGLDPEGLCLADLPMVARGARRIAVLALGSLEDLLEATGFLAALGAETRAQAIRVLCPVAWGGLLSGFELQPIQEDRLVADRAYQDAQVASLRAFAPDLVINVDRARRIQGDLLAAWVHPAGSLGFENETAENRDDAQRLFLSQAYRRRLPPSAGVVELAGALGFQAQPGRLWLDSTCQAEAQAILDPLGWGSAPILAVLGGDPPALAGASALLERARAEGWTALGLGGLPDFSVLDRALEAFGDDFSLNLAGALPLATQAALLGRCAARIGGDPGLRRLADTAGCRPFGS